MFDRIALAISLLVIFDYARNAAFNAAENHKHLHEIACHVGADELCKFHKR